MLLGSSEPEPSKPRLEMEVRKPEELDRYFGSLHISARVVCHVSVVWELHVEVARQQKMVDCICHSKAQGRQSFE